MLTSIGLFFNRDMHTRAAILHYPGTTFAEKFQKICIQQDGIILALALFDCAVMVSIFAAALFAAFSGLVPFPYKWVVAASLIGIDACYAAGLAAGIAYFVKVFFLR